MSSVFLALGSNVGDSRQYLAKAIELLSAQLRDVKAAPIYTSKAVGYTDQPDFLNTAVRAETELSPAELFRFVKDVEQQVGRIFRFRWGPREIDIDIIFYDDLQLDSPELTIPHPRFTERDFVLRPLCDIEPEKIDPVSGLTVTALLERMPPSKLAIIT